MKALIIFAGFLALVAGENFEYKKINLKAPENVEDFIKKSDELINSRIQNGNNVNSDTEWPFVVELTINMNGTMFTCSGSVININFLLSARECVIDKFTANQATSIMSRAGSHTHMSSRFYSYGEHAFYVSTPDPAEPNFATIKMYQNFPLSPQIQIIRLPTASQASSFFEFSNAYFAGWGTIGDGSSLVLQHAGGTITSQDNCSSFNIIGLSTYDLCIQSNNPQTTLNAGDMGGPVIIREADGNTLIGVLDRTASNFFGQQYNLMFRVGIFWNFIHDTANVTRRF